MPGNTPARRTKPGKASTTTPGKDVTKRNRSESAVSTVNADGVVVEKKKRRVAGLVLDDETAAADEAMEEDESPDTMAEEEAGSDAEASTASTEAVLDIGTPSKAYAGKEYQSLCDLGAFALLAILLRPSTTFVGSERFLVEKAIMAALGDVELGERKEARGVLGWHMDKVPKKLLNCRFLVLWAGEETPVLVASLKDVWPLPCIALGPGAVHRWRVEAGEIKSPKAFKLALKEAFPTVGAFISCARTL